MSYYGALLGGYHDVLGQMVLAGALSSDDQGGLTTHNVSATEALLFGDTARPGQYSFAVSSTLLFADAGNSYRTYAVAATSTLLFADHAYEIDPQFYNVSATDHVFLFDSFTFHDTSVFVSASDSILFADTASQLWIGNIYVSATEQISFSDSFVPSFNRCYASSATEALLFFDLNPLGKDIGVGAAEALLFADTASENRMAVASATEALRFTDPAVGNRWANVSASSTLVFTATCATSNLKSVSASSSLVFSTGSSEVKANHVGVSTIVFVDLARAVKILPWRRGSLAYPDGGGLAHS